MGEALLIKDSAYSQTCNGEALLITDSPQDSQHPARNVMRELLLIKDSPHQARNVMRKALLQ